MRSDQRRPQQNWNKHITNERIRGEEFRLIDDQSEQIGLVNREEALAYAKEHEVDLVLIAAQAKPPVVKAIDYHKFLYQEEKKNKESKKGQKKGGTKDIQISLFIGDGDLVRLARKAQEFLTEGFQVRVKLVLHGREMGKKDMAFVLIKSFISKIEDAIVAVPPKFQGRVIFAVIVKKK